MMEQKLRGGHRRRRLIERWRKESLELDTRTLLRHEYHYVKLSVRPWSDLSMTWSVIPPPRGMIKRLVLASLLDIFDSWEKQLNELGQPYYLRIWLFEPRFAQSQVVCAIGSRLHWYDHAFTPAGRAPCFLGGYGELGERLSGYSWCQYNDEDFYEPADFSDPAMKRRLNIKASSPESSDGDGQPSLIAVRRGSVWIGGRESAS